MRLRSATPASGQAYRRGTVTGTLGGASWSPRTVWRILCRHGISTRQKRFSLVAGAALPPASGRDARFTSALLEEVQHDLKAAGWHVQSPRQRLRVPLAHLPRDRRRARYHPPRHACRPPQSNGVVERVQRTILEECWRRSFARSLIPKLTALRRDLKSYLRYYNHDRVHTGRLTNGRTPATIIGDNKMLFQT